MECNEQEIKVILCGIYLYLITLIYRQHQNYIHYIKILRNRQKRPDIAKQKHMYIKKINNIT